MEGDGGRGVVVVVVVIAVYITGRTYLFVCEPQGHLGSGSDLATFLYWCSLPLSPSLSLTEMRNLSIKGPPPTFCRCAVRLESGEGKTMNRQSMRCSRPTRFLCVRLYSGTSSASSIVERMVKGSCWFLLLMLVGPVMGDQDAKRLYEDLLTDYNRLIRPVGNNSDRLTVKLGLKLSQLIDVVYYSFSPSLITLSILPLVCVKLWNAERARLSLLGETTPHRVEKRRIPNSF